MRRALRFLVGMSAAFAMACGSPSVASMPDGDACAAYCKTIMANCTADNGTLQYDSSDACVASCATFPVGTTADQAGNTLGCRTNYAMRAKDNPALHCSQAGPGGDNVCGEPCDGYCQIALAYCAESSNDKIYDDPADCQASCAKADNDIAYSTNIVAGNHIACLLTHAQAAAAGDPDAHCLMDLAKDATQPMAASHACR